MRTHTHTHAFKISLKRTIQQITNFIIITQIEDAYRQFKASKKTLEEYFDTSIMFAIQSYDDKFNLKATKIKFNRVILVFGGKREDEYYLGEDVTKLHSTLPIEIKAEALFSILRKPPLGNKPIEQSNCTIYKLKKVKNHNGKEVIRGHKHYSVPGGDDDNEINVGVWEWNSDGENTLFWLPSQNLIENVYRCTKTPSCSYSTSEHRVSNSRHTHTNAYTHTHTHTHPHTHTHTHNLYLGFGNTRAFMY